MTDAAINEPRAWSRRFWWSMAAVTFLAQLALIFIFGARHPGPIRAVTPAPRLHLVDSANEFIALSDPTLFALPHENDFGAAVRNRAAAVPQPFFHWAEPDDSLPLTNSDLLNSFNRFMQTNPFATGTLDFKPPPVFNEPALPDEPQPVLGSSLFVRGELAGRRLFNVRQISNSVASKVWPETDVIAPSRVQVLVDPAGQVVSAILLSPDYVPATSIELEKRDPLADRMALELARSAQFSPGLRTVVGQIIFNWHAVPPGSAITNIINSPVKIP